MNLDMILEYYKTHRKLKLDEVRDGYARVSIDTADCDINHLGAVSGGSIFNIADLAAGLAFLSDKKSKGVTADSNISFLRTAKAEGDLYCTAVVDKRGRTLDYISTEVRNESDVLIAKGSFQYCRIE